MADTGKEIKRPDELYMVRQDGVKLYKYASDNGFYIIQHPTERKYSEAIDVESAAYTYTETDEPIAPTPEPETDLTVTDTLEMLKDLGVDTSD